MEARKFAFLRSVALGTALLVIFSVFVATKADNMSCGDMLVAFQTFDYTDRTEVDAFVNAHKHKAEECSETMTCGQIMKEVAKRQLHEIEKCAKELNFKTAAEKKARSYCQLKCIMKKAGILTADGKIDDKFFRDMLERFLPIMPKKFLPMIDKGEEMFMQCRRDHEHKFDDQEESCRSYSPLIKCAMGMATLCV